MLLQVRAQMTRRAVAHLAVLILSLATPDVAQPAGHANVVVIVVDYLSYSGCYPQSRMPNIDRLASRGVSVTNASAPAPACNPSLAAVMFGFGPYESSLYYRNEDWRAVIPFERTLVSRFRKAGYDAYGVGKIFRDALREMEWTDHFVPSLSALLPDLSVRDLGIGGLQFYPLKNSTEEIPDYHVVNSTITKLQQHHERPFFLAIGLAKPHMPWAVPRKYFDLSPVRSRELPPYAGDELDDVPEADGKSPEDLQDHNVLVRSGQWPEAIQGYVASIAFADEQIGRLLDALDKSAYSGDTTVVLRSDNRFHLGEKRHWHKAKPWQESTRVQLTWVAPGVSAMGALSNHAVDLMCIFPTLCERAGIDRPEHVKDTSLVPLLISPKGEWRHASITTSAPGSSAVRTERWRFIRHSKRSEEPYDHATDPHEWHNLADVPGFSERKAELPRPLPTSYAAPAPEQPNHPRRPTLWQRKLPVAAGHCADLVLPDDWPLLSQLGLHPANGHRRLT